MFIRPFGLVLCLLLCVCGLFGLYRLQAQPQETQPTPTEITETKSDVGFASEAPSDVHRDFTQTIISNNLFARLGTNLHDKPRPGANLTLVGTFVQENPAASKALIKDATGRHRVLAIGEVLGAYQVLEIQPKHVRLDQNGNTVILRLPQHVLLNATRR